MSRCLVGSRVFAAFVPFSQPSRPALAKNFTVPGLDSRFLRPYGRYRGCGFTIIGISIYENMPAMAPFVKQLKPTFPIGFDPEVVVTNGYAVRALPSSFLINRSGTIVAIALGPRHWDGAAAREVTEALLR